jgi:pseudaminic acid cytidylyltransferase
MRSRHMKIAIIPARAGSVRIPGKNIRHFHGRRIIEYSIETALSSGLFDKVMVSTGDEYIAGIAKSAGATWLPRHHSWAEDPGMGTQEVIQRHLMDNEGMLPKYVCCIYPTAPMMTVSDLVSGFLALDEWDADFAMSVGAMPLRDAGQWYWGKAKAFLDAQELIGPHTAMVPIPESRICDINTEEEWLAADRMYGALYPGRPAAAFR